jgi:FAD/FMN-containing dehydrogenase
MDIGSVQKTLSGIVGDEYVTSEPPETFAYTQDASLFGGTEAALVVRPGSTDEVSAIMKLANQHAIPVVVRGGGSSIYGQPKGTPGKNILIDTGRMNRVLEINQNGMTVTAQAGIIMGKLQQAVNQAGYYVFVPAAPVHTVTLGGWLSGAAGGGGIWWETIGMTVVLPDGTVVTTGGGPGTNVKQNHPYSRVVGGPDFSGMFIGDGGSLGIKTEVTIRLLGLPNVTRGCILEFTQLENVMEFVRRHTERVNPHPFDPVLIFGPGANEIFDPEAAGQEKYTVMGLMLGHTAPEMDAKKEAFNRIAEELGGTHTPQLDAMTDLMAGGGDSEAEMEMFSLGFFNGLGLAAWLPFNMPRVSFCEVYPKLVAWREQRIAEAARKGFECQARFDFFAASDQCTITGEVDAFFKDTDSPELRDFVRTMIMEYQQFTHELGLLDVYNQGVMSSINASCWSSGFRSLYTVIKSTLDPKGILNSGLWLDGLDNRNGKG